MWLLGLRPGPSPRKVTRHASTRRCANMWNRRKGSTPTYEMVRNRDHLQSRTARSDNALPRDGEGRCVSPCPAEPAGALELVALRRAGEDQLGGSRDGERRGVGAAQEADRLALR